MVYRKKYEDSYLDNEDEDFDGDGISDGEKLATLILKKDKSEKEIALIAKITQRLFIGSRMPAGPGARAIQGLITVAQAYTSIEDEKNSTEIWTHLLDVAETTGNKDLYYTAMDGLAL